MREKALNLLGLMRRAGAVEIGEASCGAAVKGGKGKLLLVAQDASANTKKRAETFVYGRRTILAELPFTKEEVSQRLGIGCSMLAVTDLGFANALMKALSAYMPESYGELSLELERRYEKAVRRKAEKHGSDRNKSIGKRRTNT